MHLSDAQWEVIKPLLREKVRSDGRGRPWREAGAVLEGVLWILRTGARWQDLPREYPPCQTCHCRFQQWVREGRLERILRSLAEDLLARGALDLEEAFIDATFSSAKKGALGLVQRAAEKGPRSWPLPTAMVFLSLCGLAALHRMRADGSKPRSTPASARPRRIGDKAYDSDPLDQRLRQHYGVQWIAPHIRVRRRPASQDGARLAPLPPPLENRAPVCLAA